MVMGITIGVFVVIVLFSIHTPNGRAGDVARRRRGAERLGDRAEGRERLGARVGRTWGGDSHGLASSGRSAMRGLLVEVARVASGWRGREIGMVVWSIGDDPPARRANATRRPVRGVADTGSGIVVGACGTDRGSVNVKGRSGSVGEGWTIGRERERNVRVVRLVVLIVCCLEGIVVIGGFFSIFVVVVVGYGWVLDGRGGGWSESKSGLGWDLVTRTTVGCDCGRGKGTI